MKASSKKKFMPNRRHAVRNHMRQKMRKDRFWYLPLPPTFRISSSKGEMLGFVERVDGSLRRFYIAYRQF